MVDLDFLMRVLEDRCGWQAIDSAPLNEGLSLIVTDGRGGEHYRLPYSCRLPRPLDRSNKRSLRGAERLPLTSFYRSDHQKRFAA
jgi:hypothetical protein